MLLILVDSGRNKKEENHGLDKDEKDSLFLLVKKKIKINFSINGMEYIHPHFIVSIL